VDISADGLTKLLPAPTFILFRRVVGVGMDLGTSGLGATPASRPASTCGAPPWSAGVGGWAAESASRVHLVVGIGFAVVWAGRGGRTVGWGLSWYCPSRRWST